jgi:hypothetical protein
VDLIKSFVVHPEFPTLVFTSFHGTDETGRLPSVNPKLDEWLDHMRNFYLCQVEFFWKFLASYPQAVCHISHYWEDPQV